MIRKLGELDRQKILEYLSEEPSINLFIIGDIENFGFDEDFQELWGSFDDNGELEGVLLRYHESYIPYFKDETFNPEGFIEIIRKDERKIILSGKESIINHFRTCLNNFTEKSTYFCELNTKDKLLESSYKIEKAEAKDAERICNMIETIEEFNDTASNTVEKTKHKLETKTGKVYYIENQEGEMVSISQTTAENKYSAMVVGVATKKGYRKRGMMGACLSKLCKDVLDQEKSLCLFYDNPEAGKVYHRLGFQTIGKWTMLVEDKE